MNAYILSVPVLAPLAIGILALLIPGRIKWVRETLALLVSALVCVCSVWFLVAEVADISVALFEIGGFSLSFSLVLTPLAAFVLIFVAAFSLLVCVYSLLHMQGRSHSKAFFAFLPIALAGSAGVLLADHLVLFLIFWEIVTASLYFLINTGGPGARAGATKTFATLGGVDGCLLLGIGLLWGSSRTLLFSATQVPVDGWVTGAAFVLIMVAAITKAGSMPFSSWLPAASKEAPAPVMALLPASIDKLLGIFLLVRISTSVFVLGSGFGLMLMIIGAATIVAAVMVAVVQHDLRQLLSYHAVSQVGYMILGIGTLTPIGLIGGLFHMINNSVYKSCLFLCAGAVERKAGTTDLGKLGGLARGMPVTFVTCLIAALAISGVPPFNGFVSKWMVYQGVIETATSYSFVFLVAAMFGSALTLASFIKVIYSVFLGSRTSATAPITREAGPAVTIPLVILAAVCVLFGVYYRLPVEGLIVPGVGAGATVAGVWNSTLATGLILLGIIVGVIVFLLGRFRKSVRVVEAFTGGELLDEGTARVSGTNFYDTLRSMPGLRRIYGAQEQGHLDPYRWIGALGLAVTGLLKRVHNGLLSWYLSWILAGVVVFIVVFLFLM